MHSVSLPEEFRQALRDRRGGRDRIFRDIEPEATALVVIDMQNAFVAPDALRAVPYARGIVPNINRLADRLRERGAHVVWVRTTLDVAGRSSWATYFDYFAPADEADELRRSLCAGADGHRFWRDLDICDDDTIVDKDRFSAFIEGASPLESLLRERAVDTIVVAGTLTNVCCESTIRDAMMRDFKCILIEDANAAPSDEEHLAGLRGVATVFADVMSTDEFFSVLDPNQN